MARRRCGDSRVVGGVYLTSKESEFGVPLSEFLIDPIEPIDIQTLKDMGVSPIGMHAVPVYGLFGGIDHYDIYDWVGESFYPYWPDKLEEDKRFGVSRKMARTDTEMFGRIDPNSMGNYVVVHANAVLSNAEAYYAQRQSPKCATRNDDHLKDDFPPLGLTCQSILWEAVDGEEEAPNGRQHKRKAPEFEYTAWKSPAGVYPRFSPGIVMRIPFSFLRYEVIDGAPDVKKTLERLEHFGHLETALMEE